MSSTTEQQMNVESKLRACSIAKDNALQVVFHEETKAHDKEDELARNDRRINACHERDLENEQHDRDTKTRNVDYGHYLLDQIQEKEDKKQNAPHPFYNSTAFCEDYVDPVEKNRLKLQKQKEMRDGLDECVRQKNVFKRELEVVEAAEDEKRNEFLETQDNNTRRNEEQVKQRFEEREDRKNHAAMWRYENNGADAVNVEEPTKIFNTPEMMKIRSNIQERKAILEEMKKKVDDAFFKSDEDRKIIRKLTLEVQEEENKLEKLKNESQSQSSQ